jgi:hypothetical protein
MPYQLSLSLHFFTLSKFYRPFALLSIIPLIQCFESVLFQTIISITGIADMSNVIPVATAVIPNMSTIVIPDMSTAIPDTSTITDTTPS